MKRGVLTFFILLFILVCAPRSHAQTVHFNSRVQNNIGLGIANAVVTVCATSTSSTVCSSPVTVTTADAVGNYSLIIAPGTYDIFLTGSGFSTFKFTQTISPDQSNINNIVAVDGVTYTTIAAAQAALPANKGTVMVTASSPAQTISTTLTLTGQKLAIDDGVTVTIGTGGAIILGANGVIDGPGATIAVIATSGDAIRFQSGNAQVRLGNLTYTGGAGTTNGLVFIGTTGAFQQAQFNEANITKIAGFPGTNVVFGRSGVGGAINNRLIFEQISNGANGVLFTSGISGTDVTAYDEGNRLYGSLIIGWTGSGVKFGDGGSLGDSLYNEVHSDVHDQTAGGVIPVSFTDQYNYMDGALFSNNQTLVATFGATAKFNILRCPTVGAASNLTGAGLFQNTIVSDALIQASGISGGTWAPFRLSNNATLQSYASTNNNPFTLLFGGTDNSVHVADGSRNIILNPGTGFSTALQSFSAALSTKTTAYTLAVSDSWVNVTGTTTITVPHALTGQRWVVFNSGANTVTVQADSGNINGGANITLSANTGKEITCDGTNCFAH